MKTVIPRSTRDEARAELATNSRLRIASYSERIFQLKRNGSSSEPVR